MFRRLVLALLVIGNGVVNAADSLFVTVRQADSIFIVNNLVLLAETYNIEANQALIIASKAYPNPIFTADFNVYDPQNKQFFHVGNTGQKQFLLEQLILVGGKRKAEIDIARKNVELAKLEFEDLVRTLSFELHSSFFRLNQYYRTIRIYDEQIELLDSLITLYEVQVSKNNIPLKDLTRLKSIYFSFNSSRSELRNNLIGELGRIQLYFHSDQVVVPQFNDIVLNKYLVSSRLDSLLLNAYAFRPDYKISTEEVNLALLELKLQRRMAIPDIKLNFSYDQRGGAFINQFNSGFTMPIPLWNFNRGMVKYSKAKVSVFQTYYDLKKEEIANEVRISYYSMETVIEEYKKISTLYNNDFASVYAGMTTNFLKRNVSLIEFADFIESYNQTVTTVEDVKARLAINAYKVNMVTATNQY